MKTEATKKKTIAPAVNATFGDHHVDAQAGASISMSLGPAPDVNVINLIGTETSWAIGDLVITDGITPITITKLEPFAWQVRNGRDGLYTEIQIRDSRQNWQRKGAITGEWNKPFADGAENQQKTVQALVALCLDGLGETGYDVSALPTDFYPYVRWEAAKPGAEASQLCQMCNCALGLDQNGHAKVYSLGAGASIPDGYKEKNDLGRQKRDIPDYYLVRGAQNIVEVTSTLIPVGLDTDGTVKPLASLSYYASAVSAYGTIGAAIQAGFQHWAVTAPAQYAAAIKSCGLWFRIPDAQQVLLPALPAICETEMNLVTGKPEWRRPYVLKIGEPLFFDKQTQRWTAVNDINQMAWELDEKRGIVKFTDGAPLNADGSIAGVQLVWAYHELHSDGTLQQDNFYTYTNVSSPPSNPTVEIIPAEWLQLRKIVNPDSSVTVINQAALDAIAAKIITYYSPGDAYVDCAEVIYSGLNFIYPDGKVRKVIWHVGADGAYTTLVYNTERPPIGGARLERKIEGLKKDWLVKDSAAMAYKNRLAGVSVPPKAAVGSTDRSGFEKHVRPESRRDQNDSGEDAPFGAILWLRDGPDPTTGLPRFQQPQYPGISQIDVAADVIPAGLGGLAVHVGRPLVLLAPGLTVNPDDRLGATAGQWYATKQDLGPMTVKGMATINGTAYAEVDLHRRQGDEIYVIDPATGIGKSYRAVLNGTEIAIAPGSVAGDFSGQQ